MFASVTAKVVTAVCAAIGAIALLGTFFVTVTEGSPYVEFALAMICVPGEPSMLCSRTVLLRPGVRRSVSPSAACIAFQNGEVMPSLPMFFSLR